jgi:tyrosine-specific transport protein
MTESGKRGGVLLATFTLAGTIIGAGILGLPHVVGRSGYPIGLFWMLLLAAAVTVTHLLFGEIVAATPERHRLIGYVGMYLGRGARTVETAASILGLYGATLAYMILGGIFFSQVLSPIVEIGTMAGPLLLFLTGLAFVWHGVNFLAKAEFWLSVALVAAFLLLTARGFAAADFGNLARVDFSGAFLPYGVVLFAYGGLSAIPEIHDLLDRRRTELRRGILFGTLLAASVTILFVTAVLAALGPSVTPDSISGLSAKLGGAIPSIGAVAGLLAVVTSYYVFSLYLKNQFQFDFKLSRTSAVLLAVGTPYALYLLGVRDFGRVLELVGASLLGVEGMLVCLTYLKAKKAHPEGILKIPDILVYFLAAVYATGALYELIFRLR